MDEMILIEDIITTKNTLTILHRIYLVNQNTLQLFSSIFDSINQLIHILTYSSTKQIQIKCQQFIFIELKETLNQLSDAIITKNISTIPILNEQLYSYVQQFQIHSSDSIDNEQTADNLFQKELHINTINQIQSLDHSDQYLPILSPNSKPKQGKPFVNKDPFVKFRFSRKPISSKKEEDQSSSSLSHRKCRLMISYNHKSKSICLDIYNRLIKDGYHVWIDLEQMHGSTLVAMAKAIEESDIIIYCLTEEYSQSINCQKEAEYAFIQQKRMIPVILQSKYKPKGWLGLLLGASFYIDFTKNDFHQNYLQLIKEIQSNTNENDQIKFQLHFHTNENKSNETLQSIQTTSTTSRSCVLF